MQSPTTPLAVSEGALSTPARDVPERRRGWYEDGHLKPALVRQFREAGALVLRGFVPAAALRALREELARGTSPGDEVTGGLLTLYGFATGARFRELVTCLLGPGGVLARGPVLLPAGDAAPLLDAGLRVEVGLEASSVLDAGDVRIAARRLTHEGLTLAFDVCPRPARSATRDLAPEGRRQPRDARPETEEA